MHGMLTRCLSRAEFGVVGLLDLGVVGLDAIGPERETGNGFGETDLLSATADGKHYQ